MKIKVFNIVLFLLILSMASCVKNAQQNQEECSRDTIPIDNEFNNLDEDSWIDWFIINEIAKNGDGNFYSSCYMHLDTCGKIAMGPIWDYDTCFGNNIFEDPRNPEGFYVRNSEWYSRLMEDDLFAQHVHERFAFFYNNKDEYYNFLRLQAQSLHPAIKSNDEIWHTIGEQISPYLIPCETYEEDLNLLIVWLEKRMEWLKNNL